MSPHCQVEGAHGLHFAPCTMVGEGFIFSDLCTGTPVATVVKHGKKHRVTDVVYLPVLNLVRFTYEGIGVEDFAEPDQVKVSVLV